MSSSCRRAQRSTSTSSTVVEVARCFGDNLVRCRKRVGLSQEELGFRASIHRTQVGILERGARCPRIDTLVKLAGALDVSVDELLDGMAWRPGSAQPGRFGFEEDSANDEITSPATESTNPHEPSTQSAQRRTLH